MNACLTEKKTMTWNCKKTWIVASKNTLWCLLGCSIGDFGTIAYFQFMGIIWPVFAIMILAMANGLITSILLETFILSKQMGLRNAFKTATGMSFISMVAMETAMNLTDVIFTGGAVLTWWVIPIMLIVGFVTPLPYNYWRLQVLGKSCH
tara:strand:- start:290 stop:739 length:450 start_codon:yes stop_codon:yes gene_type:complete